jgi:hypothetical protein
MYEKWRWGTLTDNVNGIFLSDLLIHTAGRIPDCPGESFTLAIRIDRGKR